MKATTAVAAKDLALLVAMPALAAAAWLTPPRSWPAITRAAAPLAGRMLPRGPAALETCIRDFLGAQADAPAIARDLAACEIEKNLQTLREHLPWRWRPRIELDGIAHLAAALERGRGAVLWDSHFYFAGLVTKKAFHEAGYRLHHLSTPAHGFSDTAFGRRVLNPVRTAVERRYLGARVAMSADGPRGAMRRLLAHLKTNGLVSVTVRPAGLHPVEVPLFAAQFQVATGAPDLAHATGAALLPVFTVRRADGTYRVTLEQPIAVAGTGRRRAAEAAAIEYGQRLEPHLRAYPGQWTDWLNV